MKKKLVLLILSVVFSIPLVCVAQGVWQWGRCATGGYTESFFNATDVQGNMVVTGQYSSAVNFGSISVAHTGQTEAFVAKYDTAGNTLWVNKTDNSYYVTPVGVTTDAGGNVYLLGEFYDTSVTVGGHVIVNSFPLIKNQYFLAKYSSAGALRWVTKIGDATTMYSLLMGSATSMGALATDRAGNVYVSCSNRNSFAYGSYSIVNADATGATDDLLVVKLDSGGVLQWARSFGGKKTDIAVGISVTSAGMIYVAGAFQSDTLRLGSNVLTDTSANSSYWGIYLAKLDNNGNAIWARGGASFAFAPVTSLAVSPEEDAYITGNFQQRPLVAGTTVLPPPPYGVNYGFLIKYDSAGTLSWAKALKGRGVMAYSSTIDPCENIWVGGTIGQLSWTDTLDGHVVTPPANSFDPIFIAGWNSSGSFLQATSLQSGADDMAGISADNCGNIYYVSDYQQYLPSGSRMVIGPDTLPVAMNEYFFVAKYKSGLGCASAGCGTEATLETHVATADGSVSIYPNPAVDELTISQVYSSYSHVAISNGMGQVLIQQRLLHSDEKINIALLPKGLYFVTVSGAEGVATRKFLKM